MPVPAAITDLSATPASNSPAGSETPSSTDDYLRTHAAFIRQVNDLVLLREIKGPAFNAIANAATSMANNTNTKINIGSVIYNHGSGYDPTTSRFTPSVGGIYHFTSGVEIANSTGQRFIGILKNGVGAISGSNHSSGVFESMASGDMFLNGTTDYAEVYATQASGGALNTTASLATFFQAHYVRSVP